MSVTSVSILGSTGSIGTQALDVAQTLGLRVAALAAGSNADLMAEQVRQFRPALAVMADENAAETLRLAVKDLPTRVLAGADGVCAAARGEGADVVLNAVMGMAGFAPTLAAIEAKKTLALANKESLVVGGELVVRKAAENSVRILPVDSEHSAIFQCLAGCRARGEVERLILTASGGPFFGFTHTQLCGVTPAQALNHPNWKMGAKITVDSATMMNKGLEVIEAAWLFGLPPEKIEVVVHRQSVVHSAVEFTDHAVLAQMGVPDMRVPIQYALSWPRRAPSSAPVLDWFSLGALTFERPDEEAFPALGLCRAAFRRGGLAPAALSGANEAAVELFLKGEIAFLDIVALAGAAAEAQPAGEVTAKAVAQADAAARAFVAAKAKEGEWLQSRR